MSITVYNLPSNEYLQLSPRGFPRTSRSVCIMSPGALSYTDHLQMGGTCVASLPGAWICSTGFTKDKLRTKVIKVDWNLPSVDVYCTDKAADQFGHLKNLLYATKHEYLVWSPTPTLDYRCTYITMCHFKISLTWCPPSLPPFPVSYHSLQSAGLGSHCDWFRCRML